MRQPLNALVVGSRDQRVNTVPPLSAVGFDVVTVDTFDEARARLAARPPFLLVTAVKLGEYNGLHLVLQAKTADPCVAALVTIDAFDPVLAREAEQLGATFVVQPVTSGEWLAAVERTCFRNDSNTTPIRPPYERRVMDRRQAAADHNPERRGRERRHGFGDWLDNGAALN